MSIEPERLNAFQTRMNAWVSSQGLWFQLLHGGAVEGGKSAFFSGLMRLLIRFVLLLMLLGAGFWLFMAKRVEFGWFRDRLGERVSLTLGADLTEMGGVRRVRGQLELAKLVLEGGEESFFYDAHLRGVRTTMGLTDGILKPWNGGRVFIKELRTKVKSGADTDEAAALAFQSIFRTPERFRFSAVEVEDVTVAWGYSAMHRGSIRNAHLVASRTESGWKMVFAGGQFSQNWLRRLDIDRIEVTVTPEGVVFEEMRLKQGSGTISLRVEFLKGGARPTLAGAGTISGMPLRGVVPPEFRDFIDGDFSATLSLAGSTNSQEGIGMDVKVKLEEGDRIELRDRFSVFRAISAADRFRSYKKVRLTTGQFEFRTGQGLMEVRDAWLSAQDLMRVEGGFRVRPPTDEEVASLLNVGARATVGGLALGDRTEEEEIGREITLKRAAAEERRKRGADRPQSSIILGKEFGRGDTRLLEEDALMREQRSPILEGTMRLGLTKEVFDRSPALDRYYPVDPEEGLRWLEVPLNGNIFSVGMPQAEELYLRSRESS